MNEEDSDYTEEMHAEQLEVWHELSKSREAELESRPPQGPRRGRKIGEDKRSQVEYFNSSAAAFISRPHEEHEYSFVSRINFYVDQARSGSLTLLASAPAGHNIFHNALQRAATIS